VTRTITQRELRNDSGEIMRAVDRGGSFVVTRNGGPVADLVPHRRPRYVDSAELVAAFAAPPPRQARLQEVEARLEPLPLDAAVARAYGHVYTAVAATGRKARGPRVLALLIAATALSAQLPLYTRNPADFVGLDQLLDVVTV
jgi:prevent-host-death family protein